MLKVANSVINASRITGTLPVANGGTGVTTSTGTGNTVLSATPTLSGDVTLSTGNLVIGTAGKGIDFSADPSAAGMTSELLADYEEGTWTPEINTTTPPTTPFGQFNDGATYTKIGNVVYLRGQFRTNGVTIAGAGGVVYIGGLPYAPAAGGTGGGIWVIDASSWAADTPRAGSAQTNSRILLHSTATSTGAFAQTPFTALTTGAGLANLVAIGGFYYTAT